MFSRALESDLERNVKAFFTFDNELPCRIDFWLSEPDKTIVIKLHVTLDIFRFVDLSKFEA